MITLSKSSAGIYVTNDQSMICMLNNCFSSILNSTTDDDITPNDININNESNSATVTDFEHTFQNYKIITEDFLITLICMKSK